MAVLIAGGLLLTSAAISTSWSAISGGRGPPHECTIHLRNYRALHKQVNELAALYPGLKGVLGDGLGAPGHHHHAHLRMRRLLSLSAEQPQPAKAGAAPGSDGGGGPHEHGPAAEGHHRRHGPASYPECVTEAADLHYQVYYALRLITGEARQAQEKLQAATVRADLMQAEVQRLNAAAPAAPAPAPVASADWDPAMVGLDTEVVVGTPVNFLGQLQHMLVPVNDEFVGGMIRREKAPFQADRLAIMVSMMRADSTVLDVGGNLGTYTIWFARQVGPRGRVYSFEAQSFIYQVLTANLLINGHRNVHAMRVAASFKEGVTHMGEKLLDGTTGGKNFSEVTADKLDKPVNYGGRQLGEGGEEVPMITIDSLDLTDVSFIKLDIQGSEPLAVYGAQQTIIASKPVVQFENEAHLFNVSNEMVRDMGIPPEVVEFSIHKFLRSLDYRVVLSLDYDEFWVPPGYQHPDHPWDTGALSVQHLKAGLRGGQDFDPPQDPLGAAPKKGGKKRAALGQGVAGTALPLALAVEEEGTPPTGP